MAKDDEPVPGSVSWSPDYKSPEPKWMEQNHGRVKRSQKEESRYAGKVGARKQPRSGGLAWSSSDSTTAGGDFTSAVLHVEHKHAEPDTKSIGIQRRWLAQVTEGAKRRLRIPAIGLTFKEPQGHEEDWIALPLEFVMRLIATMEIEEE